MLTINADDHTFMRDYYQVDHEKRMVVILPKGAYRDWLKAAPGESMSMEFMRQYPADRLSCPTITTIKQVETDPPLPCACSNHGIC
ncbi:hypothetical protein [Pseudomonas graminis]|uniref:hypothetical protein n=1 Tax=Pseudomonas graminis TaxID=158627 RepID=UPI003C1FD9E0